MSAQSAPADWAFRHRKKPLRVRVNGRAHANSFALLRELCIAGHGITRLPCYMAVPSVEAGLLQSALDAFVPEPLPWHVVYPSSRHLSAKVRAFVDLLERRFSASTR